MRLAPVITLYPQKVLATTNESYNAYANSFFPSSASWHQDVELFTLRLYTNFNQYRQRIVSKRSALLIFVVYILLSL